MKRCIAMMSVAILGLSLAGWTQAGEQQSADSDFASTTNDALNNEDAAEPLAFDCTKKCAKGTKTVECTSNQTCKWRCEDGKPVVWCE